MRPLIWIVALFFVGIGLWTHVYAIPVVAVLAVIGTERERRRRGALKP